QRADAAFGAAADRQVLIAVPDAVEGVADGVGAARTGRDRAGAHALEPKADGHLAGGHVGDGHGHEEGADAVVALGFALEAFFLHDGQAADAAGDDCSAAGQVGVLKVQPCVLDGLGRSRHRKLGEAGHLARLALVDPPGGVEVLHFRRQLDFAVGRIVLGDRPDAALPAGHGGPAFGHRIARGVDRAEAGDHDSAFFHRKPHYLLSVLYPGYPAYQTQAGRRMQRSARCPYIPMPPSTHRTWPVMYAAPGPARKATASATSSGRPVRPAGTAPRAACLAASGMAAVISVSMKPGATALTVTPRAANSLARLLVRPISPALLAA